MWQDLGAAIALLLIIEGIMPFLSPATWRRFLRNVLEMDEQTLRFAGLTSMVIGLLLLYLVK